MQYGPNGLIMISRGQMSSILITTSSFSKNEPTLIEKIKEKGFDVILNSYGRKLTEDEVDKLIDQYQPVAMIAGIEPLTRYVLEKAANLKVVSRCGIGLDSVDLEAARELDIIVTNTPDAPTIPVAELTLGMILSLLRRIHISDSSIRNGSWERPMGNLLYKKTVGIIGCGRIGTHLARLLHPFECKILGYDIADMDRGLFEKVSIDDLLHKADIISLHIPYSKENHHCINDERINIIKQGAFIINAARGGLVDEDALYRALKTSRLGGAALDCFEIEPYKGPLKDMDNVLLTSHIGSYAKEGRMMMERQSVENLFSALKEKGTLP